MALPGPFKDGTIGFAGELKLLQFSLSAGFLKEPDSPTLLTLEAKVYPFDARLGRGPWLGVGFHGPREWTVSGSDWSYERETPARWWGLVGYSGYIGSNGLINIGVGAVRSRGNTKAAMHTSFGLRKRLPRH